jgi:hypothetical protein
LSTKSVFIKLQSFDYNETFKTFSVPAWLTTLRRSQSWSRLRSSVHPPRLSPPTRRPTAEENLTPLKANPPVDEFQVKKQCICQHMNYDSIWVRIPLLLFS